MRVIVSLVVIICVLAAMYLLGVGRGHTACVEQCQSEHCLSHLTEAKSCTAPEFKTCAAACRAEHPN